MKQIGGDGKPSRTSAVSLEDFTGFSRKFLRINCFTLSTASRTKSGDGLVKVIFSDIFFWFSTINVCLFVSFSAVSALKASLSMAAFTFSLPLLSSTSLVVVKCLTIYFNKVNIAELLNKIKEFFPKENEQQKYDIKRYHKNYILFARIYAFLFMVPCLCVMAIPFISLISSGNKSLPLNIWLPFDYEHNVIYVIAYLWTIWACSNSVLLLIAIDTLMFVLITLLSMELDILKIDLVNLKASWNSKIDRQTGKLIKRHNDLIECCGMLEKTFSPSFLFNFLQSSFVICLTAFQYTTSTDITQRIFNGSYCTAILNQILLLCYFGQKVIDASQNISVGAYDSGWDQTKNMKVKKAMMRVMERAQKPTILTAMNFQDISLESFTSVRTNNFLSNFRSTNIFFADSRLSLFLLHPFERVSFEEVICVII